VRAEAKTHKKLTLRLLRLGWKMAVKDRIEGEKLTGICFLTDVTFPESLFKHFTRLKVSDVCSKDE
jgi:hypothetical protein